MAAKKFRSDFLSWGGFSSCGPLDKRWGWCIRKCSQEKQVDEWKVWAERGGGRDVLGGWLWLRFSGVLETRTLELLPRDEGASPESSVQSSRSVVSESLRPHGLQRARPPCPSPTPGAHSNSCPSSRRCHPAVSSSVCPTWMWVTRKEGELG